MMMMVMLRTWSLAAVLSVAAALTVPTMPAVPAPAAAIGRRPLLAGAAAAALVPAAMANAGDQVTTASGLKYTVIKSSPQGKVPKIGDLIAIRFRGQCGDNVFDDLFKTEEPLYYRVGGGSLIKGIDEALPMMHLGETWGLTIPGDLAFGPKGRPATAGKPRIPSNAEVYYELAFVGFPGYEGDLIDAL